ncbi:YqaA family protein [Oceanisphaera sp. W20_SRM_FM3]|uniref:YqaA family protein n=1 Tax=Oceanisphaera sp. W20_SRM_FM3 TaxID=3240267 RepID=UPI003F96D244
MKIFSRLYQQVMIWSVHRHAPLYLSLNSFVESIFWPIPVDVMLAPMTLVKPHRAWYYAGLATFFSVLGAAFGYLLGYALWDPVVAPFIASMGYEGKIELAQAWFHEWGIWVIFIASFTPIPYKVFTVTAGMLSMAFLPFVLVSIVGRGLRFYLVAGLMKWGGPTMEAKLLRYIDILGWVCVVAAVVAYLMLRN